MAQIDSHGNVNVSKLGKKLNGPGGFINISQNTSNVVFCGAFCNGVKLRAGDGRLEILQEGKNNKFVEQVGQITFSGKYAAQTEQNVLFITERCVFRLENEKLVLAEVAPGIDIQTQILDLMPFTPVIAPECKEMDADIFRESWGGLKAVLQGE
jgi:propionate CoA-transferase